MTKRQLAFLVAGCMTLVVVVVVVVAVLMVTKKSSGGEAVVLPERLEAARCPHHYGSRPLLLISMDGFRADYLNRDLTPTIKKLAERGVHAPYMKSTYPTVTFTNHYTIVTGLYPESHGIISNIFFDPLFDAIFSYTTSTKNNGSWWGGEPIWNTMSFQGKKSATFFWPGSDADIQGRRPTYWFSYNGSVPYEDRVQKVLEWLSLPTEQRPDFISLYFDEPDRQGHATGPDSPELNQQLQRVDKQISTLMAGLAERDLLHCVNILLVADHGMANADPDKVIKLEQYVPEISEFADVFFGASGRIRLKNHEEDVLLNLTQRLSCQLQGMRVFRLEDLPKRLHYSNNRRLDHLVLDLDPGYNVQDLRPNVSKRPPAKGQHGYDYYNAEMNGLFVGYGADLQQGLQVEPFQNIELYNLMCILASVTPAPNNGSWGSLHHLLADPPAPPESIKAVESPAASYTKDGADTPHNTTTGCAGDAGVIQEWMTLLELTTSQQQLAEEIHLPWGVPVFTASENSSSPELTLLHHITHVTGYSKALKVPLWTSFTLQEPPMETPATSWSSDPRLAPHDAATCQDYLTVVNVTMTPLFPPSLAGTESHISTSNTTWHHLPYLVSNSVGMSDQLAERWWQLVGEMIPGWWVSQGLLNVVLGPVYDADYDALHDPIHTIGMPALPTDMFAVVTRCADVVASLSFCPHQSLDSMAFIFPQSQPVVNCLAARRYAQMFSAKLHDVELVTGLTLFPNLISSDHLRLVLRIHSDLWE